MRTLLAQKILWLAEFPFFKIIFPENGWILKDEIFYSRDGKKSRR